MKKVTMYSGNPCPYCGAAKALLKTKNIEIEEFDIWKDPAKAKEMLQRTNGARTIPQIFIGDHYIGGNDQLQAANRSGELDKLLKLGIKNIIITLGEKGLFYSDGKEEIFLKAISVKAIDTTGAGDAFNGGFAFSLFQGKKIRECLRLANKVAGLSTTKLGAGDGMPYLKDI